MDYGRLLRRSLEIVRDHRYLWLLALLGGEGATTCGGGNFGGNFGGRSGSGGGGNPPSGAPRSEDAAAFGSWLVAHEALIVAAVLAVIVLGVVLFVVSCVAAGATIRASAAHGAGEEAGLRRAWGWGVQAFGRVLRLRLLVVAMVIAVYFLFAALIVLGVMAAVTHTWLALGLAIWFGLGLAAVLVPVAIVFQTLLRLTLRSVVLDGTGALAGLRAAVALARRRIGPVVVLFAIELGTGIAVAIVAAVVILAVGLPVGVAAITAGLGGAPLVIAGLVAVFVGLVLLVLLVVGAAVVAFLSTLWTLGYQELTAA